MRHCGGALALIQDGVWADSAQFAEDEGLNPPADDAALAERLGRARAFLTRNPIELRPNHGLVEISGF